MNRRQFSFGLFGAAGAIAFRQLPFSLQSQLRINGARLSEHLKALAEFGKYPQGGVSRIAYSEADRQGREYVIGLMRAAKLDVSIDAAGNLIGLPRRQRQFSQAAFVWLARRQRTRRRQLRR